MWRVHVYDVLEELRWSESSWNDSSPCCLLSRLIAERELGSQQRQHRDHQQQHRTSRRYLRASFLPATFLTEQKRRVRLFLSLSCSAAAAVCVQFTYVGVVCERISCFSSISLLFLLLFFLTPAARLPPLTRSSSHHSSLPFLSTFVEFQNFLKFYIVFFRFVHFNYCRILMFGLMFRLL